MSIVTTDNRFYSEIAAAIREKNGESTLYLPADMAEAILAIKGGGDAFAAISVTYPEGSVCTCTQPGQTPLTAGDTSGTWLFVVPVGGEWRIESTFLDKRAFTDVSLSQYELKQVHLFYDVPYVNGGKIVDGITFTKNSSRNFSIVEEDGYTSFSFDGSGYHTFYTTGEIKMPYLKADLAAGASDYPNTCRMCIWTGTAAPTYQNTTAYVRITAPSTLILPIGAYVGQTVRIGFSVEYTRPVNIINFKQTEESE